MGDDIMEAMELENGQIINNSDSGCVGEHEIHDHTYSLPNYLENNSRYKNTYGFLNQIMAQNIL